MAYQIVLLALADPSRRHILEKLQDGPALVSEIAADLPISRPAVSRHLKVLKDASFVRNEPDGGRRLCDIEEQGFRKLREWLDTFEPD